MKITYAYRLVILLLQPRAVDALFDVVLGWISYLLCWIPLTSVTDGVALIALCPLKLWTLCPLKLS